MTAKETIESGILELYVCGALTEKEAADVEALIASSDEIQQEVEKIEASLVALSKNVAPPLSALAWTPIYGAISKVKKLSKPSHTNWAAITGWAATIACIAGIFWMFTENNTLEEDLKITTTENSSLEEQLNNTETRLASTTEVLDLIRSKAYDAYTLPGNQAVAPQAFAKVYFNKETNIAYIDVKGLPDAPEGKVYQVWSLKMQPLTPSSMGLVASTNEVTNGIHKFEDFAAPEAFGITLEPEGGSETPTLSQLYTLGVLENAAP